MLKRFSLLAVGALLTLAPCLGHAETDAQRANRIAFASKYGVTKYLLERELLANPFMYKGQVIAYRTKFERMPLEDAAYFALNTEVFIIKVPSTIFHGGEDVVLAVKVLGTKAEKSYGGEAMIPYGEFVGVYVCSAKDCAEF